MVPNGGKPQAAGTFYERKPCTTCGTHPAGGGSRAGQEVRPEALDEGANPIFRLPQQFLQMAVVHELDMRPMDAHEPVADDGFTYHPDELVQYDVSTLEGAAQQMLYELTMITRALQEDAAPAPWNDLALVRARLEAKMGVAWASQCLDPTPKWICEEHRHVSRIGRVEKIQERGIIATISAEIFQTRQIVEEAAMKILQPSCCMNERCANPWIMRPG